MKALSVSLLTLAFMATWGAVVYWLAYHFFGWWGVGALATWGMLIAARRIPPLVRALRVYRQHQSRGGVR